MQDSLDRIAPEGNHYRHADEGPDDMPAHVKVHRTLLDSRQLLLNYCCGSCFTFANLKAIHMYALHVM